MAPHILEGKMRSYGSNIGCMSRDGYRCSDGYADTEWDQKTRALGLSIAVLGVYGSIESSTLKPSDLEVENV